VLSPLLFLAVMKALICEVRDGLSCELLFADDFVLVAESIGGVEGERIEIERVHWGKKVDD